MTLYEHAMLGVTLALFSGVHRQNGWRIVALSGLAATLPDWDGLTLLFGGQAYATGHRTWGHNLLAATLLGGLVGGAEYRFNCLGRLWRAVLATFPSLAPGAPTVPDPRSEAPGSPLAVWILIGALAALSHLPADVVFSGHPDMTVWKVPFWWPFSERGWALPLVAWGDLGATVIFIGEMFALYRWPARAQTSAALTLVALFSYVGVRWMMGGVYR